MKRSYRIVCAMMALVMVVCSFGAVLSAATGEITTISMDVEFDQTSARSMLATINTFRHSGEANWASQDNQSVTVPADIPSGSAGDLIIDSELEEIAMQRAAEISLYFAHQRPNGDPYSKAYTDDKWAWKGENIAAGTSMDMEDAFTAWKEDDLPYSKQGHRRNMLKKDYKRIGIAHAIIDGVDYWVQEFGTKVSDSAGGGGGTAIGTTTGGSSSSLPDPLDGTKTIWIDLLDDKLKDPADPSNDPSGKFDPPEGNIVELEFGEEMNPPYSILIYKAPASLNIGEITVPVLTPTGASEDEAPLPEEIVLPTGVTFRQDKRESTLVCDYTSEKTDIVEVSDPSKGILYGKACGDSEITVTSTKYPNASGKFTVRVTPHDLSDAEITLPADQTTFEFNGTEHKPEPASVVCCGVLLEKGKDYTLSYSGNRNAGEATVTVNGIGNYKGSASAKFTINPLIVPKGAGYKVTLEYEKTPYTGKPRQPKLISIETDGFKLQTEASSGASGGGTGGDIKVIPLEDGDYEIRYDNNTVITKNAKAIISERTGNLIFDDTPIGTFEICKATQGDAIISLSPETVEYDGTEKKPKVTVSIKGDELTEGTDFKVTYSNNIEIGDATATVEGLGNFDDIKGEPKFKITPCSIKNATVTPEYTTKEATGSELKPKVTVKLGDKELKEGDDYTVAYSNNTNAGTATITVTGRGHYTDTATGTFTITTPCTHNWGTGVVTKAATCGAKGVKTFTCTKCGQTKTEDIPATGQHNDSDKNGKCDVCGATVSNGNGNGNGGSGSITTKTGDQIRYGVTVAAVLLVISTIVVAVILCIRSKRRKNGK